MNKKNGVKKINYRDFAADLLLNQLYYLIIGFELSLQFFVVFFLCFKKKFNFLAFNLLVVLVVVTSINNVFCISLFFFVQVTNQCGFGWFTTTSSLKDVYFTWVYREGEIGQ